MIALRRAAAGDAAGIARADVAAWQHAYGARLPAAMREAVTVERRVKLWEALLGQHRATHPTWVAVDEADAPIGGATASAGVAGAPAELHMLFVAPRYQRRDIGRRLFYAMAAGLVEAGAKKAGASVLDAPPALAFCKALGGALVQTAILDVAGETVRQSLFAWPDLAILPPQPGS